MPSSPEVRARRANRRQKTLDLAKRRRDEHLNRNHFDATTGLTQVDCVCELSNTFFAKRSAFGCSCSKKRKGNPKVAGGMCAIGARDRIIEWRQEARHIRQEARSGRWEDLDTTPHIASGKNKLPRTFVVEKQDISRDGTRYGWFAFRKYRTEADRQNALNQLSKNGSNWRRSEFRAKPEEEVGSGEAVAA